MTPFTLIKKTKIEQAYDTIKGYCEKHTVCDHCRFNFDGDCMFEKGDLPCDWKATLGCVIEERKV